MGIAYNKIIYYSEYFDKRLQKQLYNDWRDPFYNIMNWRSNAYSTWSPIELSWSGINWLKNIIKRLTVEKSRCNNYLDKDNKEIMKIIKIIKKEYTNMINEVKKELLSEK